MAEIDRNNFFSKYFSILIPGEIDVQKEDIFYRDKYTEIINYIKVLLTNSEDSEFNNYLEPNGALLINISPGTDIIEYLKLISNNYYLDLIELNNSEVFKTPDDFFSDFNELLRDFNRAEENKIKNKIHPKNGEKIETNPSGDGSKKKLILINQQKKFRKKFKDKSLLENFINYFHNNYNKIDFIERNLIVIWINYDYEEITEASGELFNVFDLFIKIPLLNKIDRETVLRHFSEKNPKIVFDINAIVSYTENWEVKDINQLLKIAIFKQFLNADLNEISNEITDNIINLIDSGEYIPIKALKISKNQKSEDLHQESKIIRNTNEKFKEFQEERVNDRETILNQIRNENTSEFMLNQLYENAASKNYNELLLIIDKLNKKEPLEENDRKILARYPFILNDSPNRAHVFLEKAKKRVDLMRQAFGK